MAIFDTVRGRHWLWAITLAVAMLYGTVSISVMAQTPTTGAVVSTPAPPSVSAATLAPTIAGGSANLPAGSQSTSGRPRITALLVLAVIALIVLGAGFSFNRHRFRRLP